MNPASQSGSFFDCRILSITTLIGQGSRMSLNVSPSTAMNAKLNAFQCGRMRRIRLNFPGWFERLPFVGFLSVSKSFFLRNLPFWYQHNSCVPPKAIGRGWCDGSQYRLPPAGLFFSHHVLMRIPATGSNRLRSRSNRRGVLR